MIVEFVGMSCTGKSTLVRALAEELARRGVEVQRHEAFRLHDIHGRPHPASVLRADRRRALWRSPGLLLVLWSVRRDEQRRRAMDRQLRTVGYTLRLRPGAVVHLLDEGPMKTMPKGRHWRTWQLQLLRRGLPRTDRAVHVTCDPQIRVDRVLATGRRFARGRSREWLLAHEQQVLPIVQGLLAARPDEPLVVDPTREPDAVTRVADWIEAQSASVRGGGRR